MKLEGFIFYSFNMTWQLSKSLFNEILADRISDSFVTRLVWERLGYSPSKETLDLWFPGPNTPESWRVYFPNAPQVITERKAAVYLTRSIPKKYKQSLKDCLGFKGYQISELYPRRTRRASAVNWLIAEMRSMHCPILEEGPMPSLLSAPLDPSIGHPGDLPIE